MILTEANKRTSTLTSTQKVCLFHFILSYGKKKFPCSIESIAEEMNVCEGTAKKILRSLVKNDFITLVDRNLTTNFYTVNYSNLT